MAEQTGKLIDERNEGKIHENNFFSKKWTESSKYLLPWRLYPPELEQLETDILTFLFSDVLTK